jgi:signal peptidase I
MLLKLLTLQWLIYLILFVIFAIFIRISVMNISLVISGSMLPNHEIGSRIISNQLNWGLNIPWRSQQIIQWSSPQRGDVVLFKNPYDNNQIWMKRVIGLSGDRISFHKHQLYVNNQRCTFPKRNKEHLPRGQDHFSPTYHIWSFYLEKDWGPVDVPIGEVFLMGDNRGDSIDSRVWGSIPITYLTGKPVLRIWPLSNAAWLSE